MLICSANVASIHLGIWHCVGVTTFVRIGDKLGTNLPSTESQKPPRRTPMVLGTFTYSSWNILGLSYCISLFKQGAYVREFWASFLTIQLWTSVHCCAVLERWLYVVERNLWIYKTECMDSDCCRGKEFVWQRFYFCRESYRALDLCEMTFIVDFVALLVSSERFSQYRIMMSCKSLITFAIRSLKYLHVRQWSTLCFIRFAFKLLLYLSAQNNFFHTWVMGIV